MGHTSITEKEGELKTKGTIFMGGLSVSWRYFWSNIVECLGGNSGGLDQINQQQLEIGYYLWAGRPVDFAELLFAQLVDKLKGKRKTHISFPRFLSVCFKFLLGDQYQDAELEYITTEYIQKDFSSTPSEEEEVDISVSMLQWIDKTGAAAQAEPEGTSSGTQSNVVPRKGPVAF